MQMLNLVMSFLHPDYTRASSKSAKECCTLVFGKKTMFGPLNVDGSLATLREPRKSIFLEKIQFLKSHAL